MILKETYVEILEKIDEARKIVQDLHHDHLDSYVCQLNLEEIEEPCDTCERFIKIRKLLAGAI